MRLVLPANPASVVRYVLPRVLSVLLLRGNVAKLGVATTRGTTTVVVLLTRVFAREPNFVAVSLTVIAMPPIEPGIRLRNDFFSTTRTLTVRLPRFLTLTVALPTCGLAAAAGTPRTFPLSTCAVHVWIDLL